jgi:outer membrane receptor protein involved in Fe transport
MRLFVSAQLLKEKTLQVQVGVNNLLNQQYFLTSAYTSDVAPYPIGQREVMLTLRYLISK